VYALSDLAGAVGLKVEAGANVVEFAPAALARAMMAHQRESHAREGIESITQANLGALAQTHAAVIELLESSDHADLARRLRHLARTRFGLVGAVLAVETDGPVPTGWRPLIQGQTDLILGHGRHVLLGRIQTSYGLFSCRQDEIGSVALVRLQLWPRRRSGVMALAAPDAGGFRDDMGADLLVFLARVTERCAGRWPAA
jgi:uncharacterized protein YigA (DUF484 family)